jgi:hypothetical protein
MTNKTKDMFVELILDEGIFDKQECDLCTKDDYCQICGAECLADHLIENGAIVPPCKIGDTVYIIGVATLQMLERKVIGVYFYEEGISLALDNGMVVDVEQQFGETVFRTKEQAEQKLKEMRGE